MVLYNRLAIYTVERAVTSSEFQKPISERCHSSLALMRENGDGHPQVFEELNFKNYGTLGLTFSRYSEASYTRFKNVHLFGYLSGTSEVIRPMWEEAVSFSKQVDALEEPYDGRRLPESFNCRSVAIAVLRHINIDFYLPERVRTESGMNAGFYEHACKRMGLS